MQSLQVCRKCCWGAAYLRGHVVQGACPRDGPLLPQIDGQAKIRQFEAAAVLRKQNVLWLDVPVNDGPGVQVLQDTTQQIDLLKECVYFANIWKKGHQLE